MMSTSNPARVVISAATRLDNDTPATIIIQDGLIEAIHPSDSADASAAEKDDSATHVNAQGQIAVPGLCDLYARLREPGLTRKGNIASEANAALAAGFTRILCAPDTSPTIDSVATVELIRQRAQLAQGAQVLPMAALTIGLAGEQLSELATLQQAGCPAAGQADLPIDNANVLYSAMEYAASFDLPLFMTPRDAQLGADGCAHAGAMATRLGLPGIPVAAETVALARLLELSRETTCRLHISRVSSERALQMIDAAKQSGLPVTCDVGLHHLFFTDEHLAGYDSSFHSAVPFRSVNDRDALRAAVASGVIDAICTDHAPHDVDAGLAPFPATEPGLSAYAWALPLIMQLPELLDMPLKRVFETLSDSPRRIIDSGCDVGLEVGQAAEFFLLLAGEVVVQDLRAGAVAGNNHPLGLHLAGELGLGELCGKVGGVFWQGRGKGA